MPTIARQMERQVNAALKRGKSVLLLGPRQTGKTTLVREIPADRTLSLLIPGLRQNYERDPHFFFREMEALAERKKKPIVVIDEIQKVPALMDAIQWFIDERGFRFVLTGSSARKLRRGQNLNLLPGRVVLLRLDPLTTVEQRPRTLEDALNYGSLPGMIAQTGRADREADLKTYVETYLEEEVRNEALTRNLPAFARFLELAAAESGRLVSFRALSQDIGVAHTTVAAYYQILEDTLIAERVESYTKGSTRKKLTRADKHVFFDLGVRRLAAREAPSPSREALGLWFEQWVGLELVRMIRTIGASKRVRFWRDPDGPEVDWLVESNSALVPIEVKWTERPTDRDCRHLRVFMSEYPQARRAFVVCRSERPLKLMAGITALPWHALQEIL